MALILLIEDTVLVRITLRKFLEKAGHEVVDCAGGIEGLRLFSGQRFDLVVTDLWMQAGDGLDFIRSARSADSGIPILAITGGDPRSPLSTSAEAARGVGASDVVMKPVTKAALVAAVSHLLANASTQSLAKGDCIGV
ncbi:MULTISPECIES: response regulator [unclassified Aureimonas]|uniref:response regulator n=1 Tax=unclassified Aureimonas TaxID=2615206 RepID=UPI0006F7A90B|nr:MULTISPECIES: response regulator [unclassified Aureimonas]KQT69069.1 hypothetical protein ASG54_05325 [Aureimonas sp. Leaf460]KQT69307.1 hypothetical protein ASG62_17930 [Aureimonas sp. Leaf427]